MPQPVRCAVYTRKSSEEGLEQSFNSLHAQREACEAFILSQKHEGWQLVPTAYDDGGFSGGSMERPALKSLLADVDAGLVDIIVVYKVDRLTRSLADFAKMVERFDARSVSFVSVTQAFNTTTSMGRLTLNVLLSFAQFEREVTGERIRDKFAASKAKGMWMGGNVPLGYDAIDRALVVNEPEAAQVRTLFALYLKLGSADAVVAEANRLGIRSKRRGDTGGQKLSRGSLYRILGNVIYAGDIAHKGKRHNGQHDAVVDRAIFDKVEALLASNRRKAKGSTRSNSSLLAGIVFAGDGTRLTASHTVSKGKRYRYYAGGALRVPAEELETLVGTALVERLTSAAKLAQLLPDLSAMTPALQQRAAEMAAAGAAEVSQELVRRVTILPAGIELTLDLSALDLHDTTTTLRVPSELGRVRHKLTLVVLGSTEPSPDPALIAIVAQARGWAGLLMAGTAENLAGVAAQVGVTESYIRQHIGAAFLAPDLVARIVEGRQPPELTVTRLRDLLPLPTDWDEQRQLILS